jgi:hypothetical protein
MKMNYEKAKEILGSRDSKKIGNNTYLVACALGIGLKLHDTIVLHFAPSGVVTVRTGGWRSVTTKSRINEYLPGGFRIIQKDYSWFWFCATTKATAEFAEGDTVSDLSVYSAAGDLKVRSL